MSAARDEAIQFYRAWLRIAAAASVLGNVAHATLSHPPSWIVAVAVAVGPPVVWLAAVHGLSLLVRAQIRGWTYAFAAVGTLLLGGLAAFVSFNALSDLVHRWAGYSGLAAVLVALAVDLSMGISTLALMALTRPGLAATGEGNADMEYSTPDAWGLHPVLSVVEPIEKQPGERRDQTITLRVTESEMVEVESLAAGVNRRTAEAARDIVLSAARLPRVADAA